MTALSEAPSAFGVAAGIADAERVGANAKAQAANPINKRRFMFPPSGLSRRKVLTAVGVPSLETSHTHPEMKETAN